MKRILILFFLISIGSKVSSQDSTLITTYYSYPNHTAKEIFWAKSDSTKTGSYIRYYQSGKLHSKGNYSDNNRVDKWYYYNDELRNRLFLVFDWSNFKEIHYTIYGIDSIQGIKDTNNFARFPGGDIIMHQFIHAFFEKNNAYEKLKDEEERIVIQIQVNPDGTFSYAFIGKFRRPYSFNNSAAKELLTELCESMPNWIPARGKGTFLQRINIPIQISN